MQILPGDLSDPVLVALLEDHVEAAHAATAPGSAHALDLDGLAAPDVQVWALWDGPNVVSVGALKQLDEGHVELKSMHTAEGFRGRGHGSTMVRHLIETARGLGMRRISLETGSWGFFLTARRLYERHGFRPTGPFGDYRPDANSVFMTLELD